MDSAGSFQLNPKDAHLTMRLNSSSVSGVSASAHFDIFSMDSAMRRSSGRMPDSSISDCRAADWEQRAVRM